MGRVFTALLRLPVRLYRAVISPLLGPRCRYHPTCSAYMDEALQRHGAVRGLILGLGRILRCHPWARGSFWDAVPERFDWRTVFRYKRTTPTDKTGISRK
ncbi:MAG: membrane protein insertion efficiency factor YidD [Alphaproteobacteria bacterium]|nr:membrane protein insertion efficiency factor YidD [Alphaproteobacteria bacterium]